MKLAQDIIHSGRDLTNSEFVMYACGRLNHVYRDPSIIHQLTRQLDQEVSWDRQRVLIKISRDKWNSTGDIRLISLHIPKTAGSTLLRYIRNQYTEHSILEFYDDWRDVQYANNDVQVFHGHIHNVQSYFNENPNAKKITWLREPMLRLISQYYYWKTLPKKIKNHKNLTLDEEVYNGLSFEEYLDHSECSNIYTKHWLNDVDMEMFDFVGITEKFDTDVHRMVDVLNWSPIEHSMEDNKNKYDGYSDIVSELLRNKEIVDKIKRNNDRDYELYYKYGGVDIHI